MAYLVKCPLCGRDVSSEARSCPGCGHDVASELHKNDRQEMRNKTKKGILGTWVRDDTTYTFDSSGRCSYARKKYNSNEYERKQGSYDLCGEHDPSARGNEVQFNLGEKVGGGFYGIEVYNCELHGDKLMVDDGPGHPKLEFKRR